MNTCVIQSFRSHIQRGRGLLFTTERLRLLIHIFGCLFSRALKGRGGEIMLRPHFYCTPTASVVGRTHMSFSNLSGERLRTLGPHDPESHLEIRSPSASMADCNRCGNSLQRPSTSWCALMCWQMPRRRAPLDTKNSSGTFPLGRQLDSEAPASLIPPT